MFGLESGSVHRLMRIIVRPCWARVVMQAARRHFRNAAAVAAVVEKRVRRAVHRRLGGLDIITQRQQRGPWTRDNAAAAPPQPGREGFTWITVVQKTTTIWYG